MKKFHVLKFIIRMLKVLAWVAVALTTLGVFIAGSNTLQNLTRWDSWRTIEVILNQILAFGIGISFGLMIALVLYGLAELLDLMISIQENTYSAANVLRNMYRDQLNAHHDPAMRLRDVTPEGNVVEVETPRSNGSTLG